MTYRLAYRRYALPLRAPVRTAHGVLSVREGLLVRLESEDGTVGYGEASPLEGFGRETVDADEAWVSGCGDRIDAETLSQIPPGLDCLHRAFDVARGEAPVPNHPYLPVAALLPAGKAALAALPARVELGFRTFKWKVGVGDPADEWALCTDLLAGLPTGARLRLDANGAWDRRVAERWLARCEDWPVEHVEQPVAPESRGADDLLRGLAEDYPTPIALDESLAGAGDVERWLGDGWRGVYVIKPALVAHLSVVLDRLARAGARVVFSSALETRAGTRASLAAAFAWTGEVRALGFGVYPIFNDARFDGPAAVPFVRREDLAALDPEAVWTALS